MQKLRKVLGNALFFQDYAKKQITQITQRLHKHQKITQFTRTLHWRFADGLRLRVGDSY